MSQRHFQNHLTLLSRCTLALAAMTTGAAVAQAQAPHIGDSELVSAISVRLHVGSTGKESKQATYTPPPGWYIRRHFVTCTELYGNASYSVSTVPSGWAWTSDIRNSASQRRLEEVAAPAYKLPVSVKLDQRQNAAVRERMSINSSHHALVVNATANGEGLFRGGGGLQLNVMAEIVYVGIGSTQTPVRASLGSPIDMARSESGFGGGKANLRAALDSARNSQFRHK